MLEKSDSSFCFVQIQSFFKRSLNALVIVSFSSFDSTFTYPLAFFSYIAGGFGTNINKQLQAITNETGIKGSAMNVSNMIELIKRYDTCNYNHSTIREIFSVGRQILHSDFK
ncbi:hypothetical protein KP626_00040 [Christensenella sp. MSJ-20]|nr:hypothetical protein KP626_00040 [Christensenella sp. MSJ-20]